MWWTKKRLQWIPPLAVFGITVALGLLLVVRGTSADKTIADPKLPSDGIACQLLNTAQGKPVRCAIVLPVSADKAWDLVRDYDHFPEIFDTAMWSIDLDSIDADGDNRVYLTGHIHSVLGTWPYVLHIRHEVHKDRRVASWDEPSDVFPVNRGNWTVRPLGGDKCLLSYSIEIDKARTPTFLVNNILLDQIRIAVERVRDRAQAATTSP